MSIRTTQAMSLELKCIDRAMSFTVKGIKPNDVTLFVIYRSIIHSQIDYKQIYILNVKLHFRNAVKIDT